MKIDFGCHLDVNVYVFCGTGFLAEVGDVAIVRLLNP